jgi:hypothetical protein
LLEFLDTCNVCPLLKQNTHLHGSRTGSFQPGAAVDYWALKAVPGYYTAAGDMLGSAAAAGSLAPAKQSPLFLATIQQFAAVPRRTDLVF